jgi:hypothetical protein
MSAGGCTLEEVSAAGCTITVSIELLKQVIEEHTAMIARGEEVAHTATIELIQPSYSVFTSDRVRIGLWYVPPPYPLRQKRPAPVGVVVVESV